MKAALTMTLAILLAGCGAQEDSDSDAKPVALVTLATAQQSAVAETVPIYGAVEPGVMGKHGLAAPTEATVIAIDAPVGTAVRAGQPVVRLAPSPNARLDYAKAVSDATNAQQAFARAQRLRADGLASDADVATARAAAETATATRTSLAARNAALTLRAPAAGFVESIAAAPGDLVAAGTTVAALVGSGSLRARFGVDPALAARIGKGATVHASGPNGAAFSAPVHAVDPVVDPATRLAALFVDVPAGTGLGVNSALTAQLTLASDTDNPALTIAYSALLDDAGQPYVYVVTGDVAHRRDVVIGPVSGDRVVIRKGVQPGEQVVTAGGTALEDGMKVRTK